MAEIGEISPLIPSRPIDPHERRQPQREPERDPKKDKPKSETPHPSGGSDDGKPHIDEYARPRPNPRSPLWTNSWS